MRISESVLRKIIREEIETVNEADVIGLGRALGTPEEVQAIAAFLGSVIGGIGAYNLAPEIKDGIMNLAKMVGIKNSENGNKEVNEGVEGLTATQEMLQVAGALGTLSVAVAGSASLADLFKQPIEKAKDLLLTLINSAKGTPSINQDKS